MKSSVCGFLPSWTRSPGPKCDTSNPVKNRSNIDSGNMKETMYGNQPQQQKLYTKAKSKVAPLLRLDSQGEIAKGHHFCDKSQSLNKLRPSNSFDSYSFQDSSAGSYMESNNIKSKNHIPHPSFQKSNSMPAHQSFPPPSSSLSAIRSNSFSCPAAEKLSPFSPSPRNLGHVDVFGGNCNNNSDQQQCSMSSFTFNSRDLMNCSSKNIDTDKFQPSSKVSVQESKVKCNGIGNMASVKLDMIEKVPLFDHSEKGKASASPANCVEFFNPSAQNSMNSSSSIYCSSPHSINCSDDRDLSYILFVRKPKKRRTRNKRKNRCKNQGSDNQSFVPSSCSSPIKDDSKAPSPFQRVNIDDSPNVSSPIASTSKCQTSACEIPTSSPSKPCSSFILFANADSDQSTQLEQFSDDDDFDSVVFSDDTTSPSRKCGKKRKHKQSQKQEKCSGAENMSDLESDSEQKNSSLSGLRFAFVSLSVSEDEDNDSSVDWGDLSTSPSACDPQLIFEFEFNTGLSLEAIIGQNTPTDCPTSKELRDLNVRWNKLYASTSLDNDISQHHQQVHFAGDEDLVTIHIVGDEDRGGEWHRYATERARFQKKIKDIETVIAPVLCVNHRAKVFERMGVRA